MKWIVRFISSKFGRAKPEETTSLLDSTDTVRIDMRDAEQKKSLGAEVAAWMDEHDTGDRGLPPAYDEDYEATIPDLKIIDPSSVEEEDVEESPGHDPYDSANTSIEKPPKE